MNKTRMGKRAASLLLSLVMMLSLLPTAAYAAMGNADETQGAIVSENGTGVSDDSNSSGNTDDLQVGDSKDSGNTGDQQVGGSSGSGTADDTTGAEGGADPADSVNGNDSADPQDDGDAVMPVATTVVSTSEELVAAIAAASDGDTITLGEGEFTTYGNTSPKKSLTFEGVGTNTVWTIGDLNQDAKGEGNGDCSFEGCETITFKNMTLKVDNKNYRGFIRINNTVVENCTLEGRTAYWGYETAKFVNATFNAPEGDYALWDYSTKAMTFEGCTFNISGKGVNVYVEAANADEGVTRTVAVNNCTVESTKENKAFLNIKNSTQSYDVTLSGTNTVNGLTANGTTGSALYQVETTEVTETTGKPVTVKQENKAGELETVYEVKKTEKAYVAEVNGVKYDSLQAAIDAASRNATVTMLADTRENVTISTNYLTLDLNGHTLNGGTVAGQPALTVQSRVTVKDSSEEQTGTIMREDTAENSGVSSHYVIDIQDGWLFFESGSVTNNSGVVGVKGASLVRVGDDSVAKYPGLTISGGTFTQDNFIVIKVDRGTFYLKEDGTLNSKNSYAVENWKFAEIKGGTVNGTVAAWTYSGGHNSDLTISGGTVNGNVLSVNYGSAEGKVAKVSITGGTVNGALDTRSYDPSTNELTSIDDATKATIAVTGGTFSSDPTKYVVEDSAINKNDDGTFGVAKAYLAKVGDTSYYTMDEAFKAQTASSEAIVLLRDYTTGSTFNSGSINRTVDLNGHTWTCTGTDANSAAFEINNPNATLTVKNGKVVSSQLVGLIPSAMGGTIKYDNSSLVFDGVEMTTNARSGIETNGNNTNDTVTLRNSTLNVPNGFGIYFPSSGTLTIDNSVINAKTMGVQVCSGSLNISGAGTAITVSGDGIDKTINDGAIEDGAAISIVNRAGYKGLSNIEVKGGTFTAKDGNAAVKAYNWENLTESGFTQNDKVSVSGGTFSSAVDKSLCADGYIPTQNADGTYGVKVGQYVAEVGTTKYETLQAAIAAAQDGQTVTLLADVEQNTQLAINKSITLGLNGKTIKNTVEIWGDDTNAILSIKGGAKVTITGNGTIAAKENDCYTINVVNGDLTIENGTFVGNISVVQVQKGSLTINGGDFSLLQKMTDGKGENRYLINCIDDAYVDGSAKVAISGGTFVGFDPNVSPEQKVDGKTPSFAAPGAGITKNEDGSFTAAADMTAQILDKDGNSVKAYGALADAVAAAQDGQTVTLLADAAEDVVISKSITLDLGGKTLTNTNAGKATISVKSGTVTVKNGNVVGGNDYYNIEAKKDANLTLTDVTATAGNTGSSMIDNYGTLTITSGTYNGGLDTVKNEPSAKLTITGGTFTLTKGTSKGFTGVVFNYGELTISGGEFIQSDKSAPYGQAQVIHTDKSGSAAPSTVITGGTFKNLCTKSTAWTVRATNAAAGATKVSGGAFNKSISEAYCAEGFIPTKNADGTYGVKEGHYVAAVGSKKYETLADAIRLAAKGKTVKLLADVADCGSLTISKNITLDGGGHTISGNSSISVNMPGNAAADVTIKNVNFKDIANGNKLSAFYFSQVKGKLTITGCTFDSIEYEAIQVTPMEGAEVNVSSNVFKAKADGTQVRHIHIEMAYGSGFDCEGQNIKLTVTDNQLHGTVSGDASMGIWWVGTDSTLKVDGNYMEHPETVSITLSNGGVHYNRGDLIYPARSQADADVDDLIPAVIVADKASGESKIKAYSTLAEAVAAAQDGQTVRLLADVAESSIEVNANITIDLNKMTVTGSFVTYGEVTIQNGTIDVPDGKTNYAYGKLTLADVDITGKAASSSLLSVNYNGSVTIDKDSTIVADSEQGHFPAVFIKGQDDNGKTYAPELNIYGTVQSAKTPAIQGNGTDRGVSHVNVFEGAVVKSEKLAIYLPQPCEVNITGGLVEGYCGIGIKSGTLNISGGTVRGVAEDNDIGDEYSQTNGISYDGSAIMIDSYIGYAGQVQINISGNAVVESKYSTAIREIGNDKSQTNLVGLDITGGTVLGAKDTDAVLVRDVTAKDVNISGGEFSSIVKKEYCAPGFTPVTTANSEGRYGVEIGMFTVMVTSRTTGSDSPVANVAGGGSDITYAEGITVTASAISGYNFVGWFVNEYTGTPYSTDLTCKVKPTDDWTMIAVYEPISGGKFWLTVTASEFTVNGGAVQDSYLYEQFAIGASVTVNFTGSENFLYWVNASNKVVSTEKSYTFIMGSETTLKAVYGKARQNQATVVFISHSDQIISSKAYTTNDTIQFPVPPIKMGCTFTGWSMTEADIRAAMANNSGIIQVRALYTEPSIACKVTVVYPEGTDNQVVNAVVGKAIDVTAKDIEGKTFSYWTDNAGNILGYTKTLKLAPSGDMTVKAVYDQAAEAKPVITMSEVSATTANESYVVTFMATRAVPNGYKVVNQGILWSRDAVCGEDGAAAYMQFDSNGKLPDGVRAYIGNNLDLNGVTRYDIITKYNDRTFYGRGYMVLESDAGKLLYIYTDTIASGSYDSLTK